MTTRRAALRAGLTTTAALPLVAGTSGCATLFDLLGNFVKPPAFSFRKFDITGWTLSSVSVRIDAVLRNPNPFGFRLDGLDWAVKLGGAAVAKGVARKGIVLKPRGTSDTPLDLEFNLAKTATAILEILEKRRVPLGLSAVAHLRANKFRFDVPAEFETTLPLPELPTFSVPKFALKSAGLGGLVFAVEPTVVNPNPFDVDVDLFDFDIKLGGRNVVKNKAIRNVKLAAQKERTVPFEFDVDLLQVGLTAAELANSPRLDWEVAAHLQSGLLQLPFRKEGKVKL
jgi:LEA14-like dessication related protein